MTPLVTPVGEVTSTLSAWFQRRFTSLQDLAQDLSVEVTRDATDHLLLSETGKQRMRARSTTFLEEHAVVDGCGLIFSREALGTGQGQLEWWVRAGDERFARYTFGVNPAGDRYYDYEQLEWFTKAYQTGELSLAGPYIDYLGVEDYIVTLTTPIQVGQVRAGVAGLDIQMTDIESSLVPILRQSEHDVAILNDHGSVLIGSSGRFLPGDRLTQLPEGYTTSPLEPAEAGLALLHRQAT
ncbi:cache domain-containing protein [Leucobacter sp. M11]|uniref:cache domain-containing protein n=1 Tax=Leucobacter sp. M11 TaxID=2993565 RepID=UPI002D80EA7A|nr:cache domain-containing protein [Leucobacter sp. M11]MEB4614746.1 cache domain-containing protein [Leucobacter sp. M11]